MNLRTLVRVKRPSLNSTFINNNTNINNFNNNNNINNNNNNNININNNNNNNNININNNNNDSIIPLNPILNHPLNNLNNNNFNRMSRMNNMNNPGNMNNMNIMGMNNNNNNNIIFNNQNNYNNNMNMNMQNFSGMNNNMNNNINMLNFNTMNNSNNINMLNFNTMNNNNNNFSNNFNNNNMNNINRLNMNSMVPLSNNVFNNMNNMNFFNNQNNMMQMQNQQNNSLNQNHYKCQICKNKVNKPKMCRYCSQLFCHKCITHWIGINGHCYNCKSKITNTDLINTPLAEESISNDNNSKFNIGKVDKSKMRYKSSAMGKQLKKNNNNYIMNSFINNNNNNQEVQNNNPGTCQKHGTKIDYFCVQCNSYYCSDCLVFFGQEVNKHKTHFIFQISQMSSLGIQEVINEYNKLAQTKSYMDNLIGLCNLKLKENKIKRCEFEDHMNIIKDSYMKKIDDNIQDLHGILMGLKAQKEKIENSIGSIPNGFNNIVNSNDYAQGSVMSEEIKKMNKIDDNIQRSIIEKQNFPKLSVENYATDVIEFQIPHAGQYNEGLEILNKNINLIPDHICQLFIKYLNKKVFISLSIDISMPLNSPDFPKYYSYVIIQNQKYGLEFSNLSSEALPQDSGRRNIKQINSTEFDFDQFVFMSGQDKKIKMKIYIMKIFFKK